MPFGNSGDSMWTSPLPLGAVRWLWRPGRRRFGANHTALPAETEASAPLPAGSGPGEGPGGDVEVVGHRQVHEAAHAAQRARDVALALEVLGEDEIPGAAGHPRAVARLELEHAGDEEDELPPRSVVVVLDVPLRGLAEEDLAAREACRRRARGPAHRHLADLERGPSVACSEYPDYAHPGRRSAMDATISAERTAMRGSTIRTQLVVLALAAIVPVAAAVVYAIVDASRASLARSEEQVRNMAEITAAELTARLAENEQLLSRLAQRPLVKALDPKRCDPFLAEFAKVNSDYVNLALRDIQGNAVCSQLPIPPASVIMKFPWVQHVMRG